MVSSPRDTWHIHACVRAARTDVLIVEDTVAVADTLAELLEGYGYTVAVAHDGEAALDYLHGHRLPDCILLDLAMPGMDGRTLLRHLQQHRVLRSIPVIVVSALCNPLDAAELGVVDCIPKPILMENLLTAMERCCGWEPVPEE